MQFQCKACSTKIEYDPAITLEAMPKGWRMHQIGTSRVLLCKSCGSQIDFNGEHSPYLKQMLTTGKNNT
ncbi:hypothetical protein C3Y98_05215 [Methylotenera oryzisoli]|uniref:Uncharacterized protein n=1 Tax=Methylotenera oryzisoli TaxID=2080758 RepID=A0A4Y9VRW2_9PROT|nr:hypothetical protein C3Y98_05215 [Methylotenera oryzisoli]